MSTEEAHMASTPTATTHPAAPEASTLTAQDRCDAASSGITCGAKAFARATLPSGGVLLFCGHHLRKHTAALAAHGAQIEDFTESI
jgi:hypothetical protein